MRILEEKISEWIVKLIFIGMLVVGFVLPRAQAKGTEYTPPAKLVDYKYFSPGLPAPQTDLTAGVSGVDAKCPTCNANQADINAKTNPLTSEVIPEKSKNADPGSG